MKEWVELPPVEQPAGLLEAAAGQPRVAQALVRRGLLSPQAALAFLDPEAYTPSDPYDLPEIDLCVSRLEKALREGEHICVWGDFDVDGQTATATLVSTLLELGGQVSFHIPVRARESHGVNLPYLKEVIDQGAQVVLTCDTGIAAHEAAEYARQRGVDFLVTDHHELPAELPEALARVNPRRLSARHPMSTLPGVGVAYQLARALFARMGQPEGAQALLDLAALGIVADVATQAGEARYLLQLGLRQLRQAPRPGIQAMLELAGLQAERLNEEHIGFVLGPRLNALGRLGDANRAVEFLTTADMGRARLLAQELEGLNAERQLLTSQVYRAALAMVAQDSSLLEPGALLLAHPSWPAGVIGIVASRLAERFARPVILLASPPGAAARGSARSVEGVNITAALAAHQELLSGFGGHPMAAGMSLPAENIPELRRRVGRTVSQMLATAPPRPPLSIEAFLQLSDITLELAQQLERLAPFGPGNPPLVFASRGLRLASARAIGRGEEHLALTVEDETGESQRVLWWQGGGEELPEGRFDLAYTFRPTTYGGEAAAQVEWIDFRPAAEPAVELAAGRTALQVVDCRQEANPLARLRALLGEGELQLWAEGEARSQLHEKYQLEARTRLELQPGKALAVWTAPPGRGELLEVLQAVQPVVVYLFAVDPLEAALEPFLRRLAGLVKYALASQRGQVSLQALAAACAQRQGAVRLGLEWLAARGHLRLDRSEGDALSLAAGDGVPTGEGAAAGLNSLTQKLQALLEETAAYRAYFRRAGVETLVSFFSNY